MGCIFKERGEFSSLNLSSYSGFSCVPYILTKPRNSSDKYNGKKQGVIRFCRFSTGALEMIGQRPEEECLPTRRTTSIPSGWPPSASPAKLSSASIYSRTHFQTPSGEAVVSFTCDILHSIPDTNGVLCLCECFFPCKFFESGVVLTHLKL